MPIMASGFRITTFDCVKRSKGVRTFYIIRPDERSPQELTSASGVLVGATCFRIPGLSGEVSGSSGLARREIKNSCNLDPDREAVGMRQAVAHFSEYKPFLGSNLYDGSGFQGLRHQQLHSVLRGIKKVPLDVDQGRTKHPDRKCLIRWKADLGPTVFRVQALPPCSTCGWFG
jgi:hypothetical protein